MFRNKLKEKLVTSRFELEEALHILLELQEVKFAQSDEAYRGTLDEDAKKLVEVLGLEKSQ
ncbi:MAG: hypothetical protein EOM15_18135 [Spirochaetia bacterium]|nr:hypothetical protein [Spirochaetia bacterium]